MRLNLGRKAVALALVLAGACSALALAALPEVRVGVVVDGPWPQNDMVRQLTIREATLLTEGEFDLSFPDESYLIGDFTLDTARANILRLLDDPDVDLVVTWGLLASQATCCLGELPKPVIAPVVIDPRLQGLPFDNGTSGVHNLNYVALPDTLTEELENYRAIVPFGHIAILTGATLLQAIPELPERTARALAGSGVECEYIPVGTSASEALAALSSSVDAVYVWPLFQFSPAEYRRLIDGFIERRLPSFSGLDGGDVEAGMLASAGSPEFFPKLARRIGLNIQRILLGEDPGEIPVEFTVRRRLRINMATARAIDVSPRWEVLIEAEVLHAEDLEGAYELSLEKAVQEAIDLNLDLLVGRRKVQAGAEEVARARSALKPKVDLSGSHVTIDDDRALASLGSQPERTVTAGASLSQLLYSEPAWANLKVQKSLQAARVHDLESLKFDIVLEAATTYLNLMRAKALERVQRNNLDRTRSNLDVSEVRRDIGVASAGEVLRWESELATARKSLVEAVADRRSQEIAVNRILHRALDSLFIAEDVGLEEVGLLTGLARFQQYVDTPRGYEIFANFVVIEGLQRSPELARIDAGIAAQNRLRLSSHRAFWAPTVSLQATLEEILSRGGAGSQGVAGLPFTLPLADDSNWSLALQASVPIFAGGLREAQRRRAEIEFQGLSLERAAVEEKLEQRIRTALEQARASLVGIGLSDRAAQAARGNFDLVNDAYVRGVASLLDLLDAQTAAVNAEEGAANALYDFLIDWLEAKRSASTLEPFVGAEERDAWVARLDVYLREQGVALP
ncbi:MAG: TolC family protein [Acidobacteria bacterium]|nr:TolC family protein [Acidobacteriota bacterium]